MKPSEPYHIPLRHPLTKGTEYRLRLVVSQPFRVDRGETDPQRSAWVDRILGRHNAQTAAAAV
jgi:hypothetical protein